MNYLQNQQMWETAQLRHAEMIKEAQNVQVAKMAMQQTQSWWQKLFHRQVVVPAIALNTNTVPEPR